MKTKIVFYLFILVSTLAGCTNEEPREELPQSKRTILVYMIASDLGRSLNGNIDDMISVATAKNLKGGNLIVFYSKNKQEAELFQIKEGENGVVTKHHIKEYENQSAISPQVMRGVINEVKSLFPSDSYGMILSSHGTSWLPGDFNNMLRSFGEESGNNMELTELAEALPDDAFDFLLFDACYMASVECVYELKDKADYILASSTETMAHGFPYDRFLPDLFDETAQLEKAALDFYNYYNSESGLSQSGSVSLTKTSALDQLAAITREILADKTENDIYSLPLSEMQVLERLKRNGPFMLYDFDDYVRRLATEKQYSNFITSMNETVVCKYSTLNAFFANPYQSYPITHYFGLSVFVPQQSMPKLNEWYKQLKWYQAVYQ